MKLSLSMMQAFPCIYRLFLLSLFLKKIMNSSRLGTTARQGREMGEVPHKQQLDEDGLLLTDGGRKWQVMGQS